MPIESAIPAGEEAPLDSLIAPVEAGYPDQSAFRLVSQGTEAFAVRAQSAQLAARSLDVQPYIWHGDATGVYLAQQLLKAADRGVKVRLLVDDMDARVQRLMAGDWPMEWSAKYHFISDDPLKATLKDHDLQRSQVMTVLAPAMQMTQSNLSILSPYFVPGEGGTALLVENAQAGKHVGILTNSLAANDVAVVHGGYSRFRKALLAGGVQIWELKPLPGSEKNSSLFGSSGASLHSKALVIDGRTLFVGSYNLDQRSTWLNCEQGVLVENAVLAAQLEAIFASQISAQRAWQVTLKDGDLDWSDGNETFDSDPKASTWHRFQAWTSRVLHLDAEL